jgi:hypothetical protein
MATTPDNSTSIGVSAGFTVPGELSYGSLNLDVVRGLVVGSGPPSTGIVSLNSGSGVTLVQNSDGSITFNFTGGPSGVTSIAANGGAPQSGAVNLTNGPGFAVTQPSTGTLQFSNQGVIGIIFVSGPSSFQYNGTPTITAGPGQSYTLGGSGLTMNNTGVLTYNGSTGAVTGVSTYNGSTGAVTGVSTYNGSTGAVTGVATYNGNTGAVTGVSTYNGNTGDVTGVSTFNGTAGPITIAAGANISVTGTSTTTIALNPTVGTFSLGFQETGGANTGTINGRYSVLGTGLVLISIQSFSFTFSATGYGSSSAGQFFPAGCHGPTVSPVILGLYQAGGGIFKGYSIEIFGNGSFNVYNTDNTGQSGGAGGFSAATILFYQSMTAGVVY